MVVTEPSLEGLTLNIHQETRVSAAIEVVFESLLEQMGPENETPEGARMPMVIEAKPGGRWYRDLGKGDGHLWGHVQAIKKPTLIEICGPLFMSSPVANNVQYRLKEVEGGTLITFRHSAFGFVPEEMRKGLGVGWGWILESARKRAEAR
jgi:hypothetical protein